MPGLMTAKTLTTALTAAVLAFSISSTNAQEPLRVTAIPDESPTELQRKFKPLGDYLAKKTGREVTFTPVTDYAAAVEALVNNKVDLAWFGGFTFVQANIRSKGQVQPIIHRAEDETFKSVFITSVRTDIKNLTDLKGKTFAFGSPSSTSGHLMPRSFLLQAGINPDKDMRISFSGAHDATAYSVAGGRVNAGALNSKVWEKLVKTNKIDTKKVRVFFTTPPYFDYNWSVRKDMEPALKKTIADAFIALTPATETGKQILALQRATAFKRTKAENYADIEKAARSAGLLK